MTPGKKLLKIEYGAQKKVECLGGGYDGFVEKVIFVSRTSYDPNANTYQCVVPEGIMELQFTRRTYAPPIPTCIPHPTKENEVVVLPPTRFPVEVRGVVYPVPGEEDHLPFHDPLWKVVAWIMAAVSGIAAIIYAMEGKGTASIGISGEGYDDPTEYDWCVPDPTKHPDHNSIAGYLSILASTAIRVGMMDSKDPWQKGREGSVVQMTSLRSMEQVDASIETPQRIAAGSAFSIPTNWQYEATSRSGEVYVLKREEVGVHEHTLSVARIDVPQQIDIYQTLLVNMFLVGPTGRPLRGRDVYGVVIFNSPQPNSRSFPVAITDRGLVDFPQVNSGWFHASINLESLAPQLGSGPIKGVFRTAEI